MALKAPRKEKRSLWDRTAFTRYIEGMLDEKLGSSDWPRLYWVIGEKHRQIVEDAVNEAGMKIYHHTFTGPQMFGLPVVWVNGTEVSLQVTRR